MSNRYKKAVQKKKQERVDRKMKEYKKSTPSKSQKAYASGNYAESAKGGAYYIKQQRKEGKVAYGYQKDDLYTGGRKASNYKALKRGENPYETKYLAMPGRKVIPGKTYEDGYKSKDKRVQNTRFLTKEEKASFDNTGQLYHKNYRKAKKYLDTDTHEGGKFKDRYKTFDGNKLKLDGLATAKYNQKDGKHLQNIGHMVAGGFKDFVGDPLVDALKTGDAIASTVMHGGLGLVEDGFNTLSGQKKTNAFKTNLEDNARELGETGFGMSAGQALRNSMKRNNGGKELNSGDKALSFIAGSALDLSNPVDAVGAMFKVGSKGLKGAIKSIDDVRRGTTDLATGILPKGYNSIMEEARLDRAYREHTDGKVDLNVALDKVKNTPKPYDKSILDGDVLTGEQRRIDGRTLNKKRTQTIDGHIPSKLDDYLNTLDDSAKNNVDSNQVSFDDLPKIREQEAIDKANRELSTFSGRFKEYNNINPIKFQDDSGELGHLMSEILRYEKRPNKSKKNGLLNTKTMKLPKGKQEELVTALNDMLFDGKEVITKNTSYGYLREFAEKFKKSTPEEFINNIYPRLAESLTDPQHYAKGQYLAKHGGIGKFGEFKDSVAKLNKELDNPNLTPVERMMKVKELRNKEEMLRKRNKLASEIYKLEPEEFITKYGDEVSNNPLGIKDSDWKNDNQIKELVDSGQLDDLAKRTDTNVQETFVQSHAEISQRTNQDIQKQMWDIVSANVGNGKRYSYYKNIGDNLDIELKSLVSDLENATSELDFAKMKDINNKIKDANAKKVANDNTIKAMVKEFNNIKSLVNDDPISAQNIINELSGNVKNIIGDNRKIGKNIYEQYPELKTNGEGVKKVVSEQEYQAKEKLQRVRKKLGLGYVDYNKITVPDNIKSNYNALSKTKGVNTIFNNMKKLLDFEVNGSTLNETKDAYDVVRSEINNYIKKLDEIGIDRKIYFDDLKKHKMDAYKSKMDKFSERLGVKPINKEINANTNPLDELGIKINGRVPGKDMSPDDLQYQYLKLQGAKTIDELYDALDPSIAQRGDNIGGVNKQIDKPINHPDRLYMLEDGRKLDIRPKETPFEKFLSGDEKSQSTNRLNPSEIGELDPSQVERTPKELESLDRDNAIRERKRLKQSNPLDEIDEFANVDPETGEILSNPPKQIQQQVMEQISKQTGEPIDSPKSQNLYKKWLNTWKKGVTVYNPGWHVQNFFQNKGQNYLALGTDALKPQTDAKNVLRALNDKSHKNVNVNGMDAKELGNLAKELGVLDSFGDDVQMTNKLDKVIEKTGVTNIEPTARLNHWLKQMEKGMTPEQARDSVNKYLFDYNDMSEFEKKYIKNIDPFWAFHKNNARLMGQSALENNGRVNNIMRMERGLQQEVPEEQQQNEDSMWRDIQSQKTMTDDVSGAQYNYLYDQQMFPHMKNAIPTDQNSFEGKLNPLIQLGLRIARQEGKFGNELVGSDKTFAKDGFMDTMYEDAGFGNTTYTQNAKDAILSLNPILPTIANMVDKTLADKQKVNEEEMSQEVYEKRLLNEWIKQITGHKGQWYRNLQ